MFFSRQAVRQYWPGLLVVFFSLLYFANVLTRASQKCFWYDELLTVYFCRLPNLAALWGALRTGVDSSPPGFFLLTKLSEAVFGEGPIGTRVPEIVGFWLFCVCLFVFLSRRAGPVAGLIGMLLPPATGAFYYAYEARPHAIVLGCCGLALVCWDRWLASSGRTIWLTAFSLSLFCGFMLHAYALVLVVPFAAAELGRTFRQSIAWSFWVALLAPILPAMVLYRQLQHYFADVMKGTPFLAWFPAQWGQLANFYVWLLSPCLLLLLFAFTVLLVARSTRPHEITLSLAFLLLPAMGILLGKFTHSSFFPRYFLSALVGLCLLLAMSAAKSRFTAGLILSVFALANSIDCAKVLWHRYQGWGEALWEPSTFHAFAPSVSHPLALHPLLLAQYRGRTPIALLDPLDYLYFDYYAPQLAQRIYCPLPSAEHLSYRLIQRFRECCHTTLNRELTDADLQRLHPHVLAYGSLPSLDRLSALEGKGFHLEGLTAENDHFLAEIVR